MQLTTAVSAGDPGSAVYVAGAVTPTYTPFLLMVSSTVGNPAGTTALMTVWTGATQAGAGLTQYAVPTGRTLRLMNIQVAAASATNAATLQAFVVAATSSASMTSGSVATQGRPLVVQLGMSSAVAATSVGSIVNAYADVGAGTTIGVFLTMGTSVSQVGNVIVQGYLI